MPESTVKTVQLNKETGEFLNSPTDFDSLYSVKLHGRDNWFKNVMLAPGALPVSQFWFISRDESDLEGDKIAVVVAPGDQWKITGKIPAEPLAESLNEGELPETQKTDTILS